MTLDEAVATLESKFAKIVDCTSGSGLTGPIAPNGDRFVTYIMGGIKKEGDPFQNWTDCEARLADLWLTTMMVAAVNKFDAVYWREKPKVLRFRMPKNREVLQDVATTRFASDDVEPVLSETGPLFQTLCRVTFA